MDKKLELKFESLRKTLNSDQKVHPGSIMNGVYHTVVQMTLSQNPFNSIYVHIALVSTL